MTAITYCPECGRINAVEASGKHGSPIHDAPDVNNVQAAIDDLGTAYVDESGCALLTMMAYEGRLTDYELAATGAPHMAKDEDGDPATCLECDHAPITRMMLIVEVVDEEQRLLALSCDVCGFEPEDASDWEFEVDQKSYATVHEWYCPECRGGEDGYPVWQDYLDVDDEQVTTIEVEFERATQGGELRTDGGTSSSDRLQYLTNGQLREEIAYAAGCDPTRYGVDSDRGLKKEDMVRVAQQLQPDDSDVNLSGCSLRDLYDLTCEWAGGEYEPNAGNVWGINRDNLKMIHQGVGGRPPHEVPA